MDLPESVAVVPKSGTTTAEIAPKCRCRPKKWDERSGNRPEVSPSSQKMGRRQRKRPESVAVVPKNGTTTAETARKSRRRPKKWDDDSGNGDTSGQSQKALIKSAISDSVQPVTLDNCPVSELNRNLNCLMKRIF